MRKFTYVIASLLLLSSCQKGDSILPDQNHNQEQDKEQGSEITSFSIETVEALSIRSSSAVLYGQIKPSALLKGSEIGLVISTSSTLSIVSGEKYISSQIDGYGKFKVDVSGLAASTTYYYMAYLIIGNKNKVGEIKAFTTKKDPLKVIKAVDMGLSVKWANANIGAESTEDYGDYFAWGETEIKTDYSWQTYKWCNGSMSTINKYCTNANYGTVDNKVVLEPEDDIAHIELGGNWRIPTEKEWTELLEECTWEWTTQKGVDGYTVTSKKNGAQIFLPEASFWSSFRYSTGGYYWSSSLFLGISCAAYCVSFKISEIKGMYTFRYYGYSIRPVMK